jgi:hypothetical protein
MCFLKYGKHQDGKPSVNDERKCGPWSYTEAPSPRIKTRSQGNFAPDFLAGQLLVQAPRTSPTTQDTSDKVTSLVLAAEHRQIQNISISQKQETNQALTRNRWGFFYVWAGSEWSIGLCMGSVGDPRGMAEGFVGLRFRTATATHPH